MQQKKIFFFLPQEVGAFGNNIEKKRQKPCPNFKKYVRYIFSEIICSACNPLKVVIFCKNILICGTTTKFFSL